ncbi:unnamed protein product [Cuscuta europaea]|uniref:Uncharacterized protein n=1 Tax=Cuscuta europaea TaxID=41803 RepID=A0A9P0ZIK6_CUSEU|nr:unnamed protein product [Cuscuta europaea]
MQLGDNQENATVVSDGQHTSMQRPNFTDEQWNHLMKLLENSKVATREEKLAGPTYEDADWSG